MNSSVVLVGPASAQLLSDCLRLEDQVRAQELYGLGGTALTNLTKAFVATGRHVELVTLAPELEAGDSVVLEGPGMRILIGSYRRRARHHALDAFREERRRIRHLLAGTSSSVINAHWTYEFALGAIGLRNRATIVTAHDSPFTVLRYQRPRSYRALRAAMAVALRFHRPTLTAVSPYLAARWRKQMLYRAHIPVVPNVVPLARTMRVFGGPLSAPILLEVADSGHLKNVKTLLKAMPAITAAYPAAQLCLAGYGLTTHSALAGLARRLGVSQSVRFLGRITRSELDALYGSADLFVHASLEEACPMSVAEAMAHGLPVIGGSRAGGVPWILDEGASGLLVDVRKPDEIAKAALCLLEDRRLRERIMVNARHRIRSCFSPEAVSDAYFEVYRRAQPASA